MATITINKLIGGAITINSTNGGGSTPEPTAKNYFTYTRTGGYLDDDWNEVSDKNELTLKSSKAQTVRYYVDGVLQSETFELAANTDTTIHPTCGDRDMHTVKVEVEDLTYLTFKPYNIMTSIDVSYCSSLTQLVLSMNDIQSLNVLGCSSLTTLYCDNNSLTSLDVSNLTSLTTLECSQNRLSSLNLTGTDSLTTVNAYLNEHNPIPEIIGNDGDRVTINYE